MQEQQQLETKSSETLAVSDVPVDLREKLYDMLEKKLEEVDVLDFVDIFETNRGIKIKEKFNKFSKTDLVMNIRWEEDETTSQYDFTKNPRQLSIIYQISNDDGNYVSCTNKKFNISNKKLSGLCSGICNDVRRIKSYS